YLAARLAYRYQRDTVTVSGNVVEATHGETISGPSAVGSKPAEVLGSGTGSQPMQQFTLRQAPLTCVAAPNATGTRSTLEVYVNNTRWEEADSLLDLGPTGRSYVTQT